MDVDRRETLEKGGCQQVHVARADNELDALFFQPRRHGPIARLAAVELLELEHGCGDARMPRAGERLDATLVGRDGRDGQSFVDECLEIGAGARDEDADHTSLPITVPAAASSAGTTAHIPTPRLKTRRCSSSETPCSVSQA